MLAVVVVVGVSAAGCNPAKGGPEKLSNHIIDFVTRRLDLNDEQRLDLENVRNKMLAVRRETQSEHDALAAAWMAEIRKEKMNPQRMMQLIEQRHALVERNAPRVLGEVVLFHQSLTPEQRERIATRIGEMREWANKGTNAE
jgi:hypothetical protein